MQNSLRNQANFVSFLDVVIVVLKRKIGQELKYMIVTNQESNNP
jgi:hypothetical protein